MISLKVIDLLEKEGKTKYWLYKQLGMREPLKIGQFLVLSAAKARNVGNDLCVVPYIAYSEKAGSKLET